MIRARSFVSADSIPKLSIGLTKLANDAQEEITRVEESSQRALSVRSTLATTEMLQLRVNEVVPVDSTTGERIIMLAAATAENEGSLCEVLRLDTTNTVRVLPCPGQTVQGATDDVVPGSIGRYQYRSVAGAWWRIAL